jgi:hypothetical protein
MNTFPVRCLPLLAAFAVGTTLVPAQTTLSVDATNKIRFVDDRMFGTNAVMWDAKTADAQTISLLRAADLRMLRIPGGSLSNGYHWRTGYVENNTYHWPAATDAFITLITSVGANATVSVNYGSGTPEEAAAWVAYMNAPASLLGTGADVTLGTDAKGTDWKTAGYWSSLRAAAKLTTDDGLNFLRLGRSAPVGIKNWEIGNENYGSWETDQQAVAHDPYTYGVRAKAYIALMKAIDPTIRVGLVVVTGEDQYANNTNHPATNPRTNKVHNGWTPVLLTTLKSLGVTPDALVYHRYEQAPGRENDATLLQSGRTWPADAADLRQQLTDYLGTAGGAVELVVTENNSVYSDPGKQSTSLVDGLFYADSLGNILQTEFNEFVWWALRNGPTTGTNMSSALYGWRQYGDYGILASDSTANHTTAFDGHPTYYAMKLASHFARGGDTIVKATSTNTLVSVFGAKRTNGTLTLLVVNKSPTDDLATTITVTGFTPKSTATLSAYGVPQDEAARTGTGSTDLATSTISNAGASFSLTFPHYSATVVTLAQAAPTITVQPTGGTTGTGANVSLSIVASGYAPLTYQWKKDGVAVSGATLASLALSNITTANSGAYTVVVTDAAGAAVTSSAATVTVSSQSYTPVDSRLVNISTRAQVGVGDSVMIAGFSVGGMGAKKVLIRAVGPGLAAFGVPGTLADPQLELTKSDGTPLGANDNWGTGDAATLAAAGKASGAFDLPDGSKDAAMIATLPASADFGYTVTVKGANGGTGVALVEVYDMDNDSAARLVNISTRAPVSSGSAAMIGGFAIRGAARTVLLRAVGPTLGQFMSGTLADPVLALTKADGTPIVTNDNWEDTNGTAIAAAGAQSGGFALLPGSKDAALLLTLNPENFTGIVEGKAGTTGVALFEAYEAK